MTTANRNNRRTASDNAASRKHKQNENIGPVLNANNNKRKSGQKDRDKNIGPVLNANNNKRKSGQKDRDKNIGSGKGRPKHRLVLSKNGKSNVSGCYLIAFFRQ